LRDDEIRIFDDAAGMRHNFWREKYSLWRSDHKLNQGRVFFPKRH